MVTKNMLCLHEEVMLLALKNKEGTIASGTHYQFAIAGAILAELLLSQRIEVEQVKKKKFVNVVDPTPLGEPMIDECLEKIRTAKRRAQLQTWVSKISGIKDLKHRAAEDLIRRGILRANEEQVLLIFNQKVYPEVNPLPEKELVERLRQAVFTDSENIDPRTVVILSLANSAELLKVHFEKKKLKARKKRIEQVVNGEMTGKAAQEAIQAMQAAVMVVCMSCFS